MRTRDICPTISAKLRGKVVIVDPNDLFSFIQRPLPWNSQSRAKIHNRHFCAIPDFLLLTNKISQLQPRHPEYNLRNPVGNLPFGPEVSVRSGFAVAHRSWNWNKCAVRLQRCHGAFHKASDRDSHINSEFSMPDFTSHVTGSRETVWSICVLVLQAPASTRVYLLRFFYCCLISHSTIENCHRESISDDPRREFSEVGYHPRILLR
jgi:hypothetical protein